MSWGKIILTMVLAGFLGIGFAILSQQWQGEGTGPGLPFDLDSETELLDRLPHFELPDSSGEKISSSRWAGKVVVLNFWATWCPPCLRELPLFDELQRTHPADQLQIVGIAIDDKDEVQAFLEDHPMGYPMLLGDQNAVEMSQRLGNRLQGLPFTVIFDAQGKRVHGQVGEMTRASLAAHLEPLLSEAGAARTTAN